MSGIVKALDQLDLPTEMAGQAGEYLQDLLHERPDLEDLLVNSNGLPSFVKTLATSDYFAQTLVRNPALIDDLLVKDKHIEQTGVLDFSELYGGHKVNHEAHMSALRLCRHLHMLGILWRANGSSCRVESTLLELSALADHLIQQAVAISHAQIVEAFGAPGGEASPDQLCVIAMGKLGGGELNMSSDIDVILTHSEAGETQGRRRVSNREFFTRQGKVFTDLLASLTVDGFCYRVDTRLRPFGTSGQPCVNFSALEHYLAVHGREWERYAYVKQRVVTGSDEQQLELKQVLTPFVYRKYLDYGVFDELRSMKALIAHEVTQRDLKHNIKRGPGGIRELEFIVQTMQLVFGGKYPGLQTPSFFSALNQLSEHKFIPAQTAKAMLQDYCFLRRVENGVQGFRDQQTHTLPTTQLDQQRLAVLMGTRSYEQLVEQLTAVRERVQNWFDDLSVTAPSTKPVTVAEPWQASLIENEALASFNALETLRNRLEKIGRKRLDELMPRVIDSLKTVEDAAKVAPRLSQLLSGIGRRSAYFSLLLENPVVLDRVVTICHRSPELAMQLSVSPVLLDTLVDPRGSSVALDRDELAARLAQQMENAIDDEERQLIALREFRKAAMFDLAVADIESQLSLMKISDRLTDIAELVLECALKLASAQMQARHGVPRRSPSSGDAAQFAVIGYGKLGGIELGYGSDLDLVFVYDDDGNGTTDGANSIDNALYFAKLSRRLIHILTVPTRAGTLYEVDMRLRPSGRSGALVSRLSAFATYQTEQAWTWEHQALIRSRAVAGDAGLCTDFEALRATLLQRARDKRELATEVADMRRRMKKELDRSSSVLFDLKHGEGGLVDIEFVVQYLVLAYAHSVPKLVKYSDNIRQLDALVEAGLLPGSSADKLRAAYLVLRRRVHAQALAGLPNMVDIDDFLPERAAVRLLLAEFELAPISTDPDILSD